MVEQDPSILSTHKVPHFEVPDVVVLDFDRTLGPVDAAMKRFYHAIGKFGLSDLKARNAQEQAEDDGGSFEPMTFVRDDLDEEQMKDFYLSFLDTPRQRHELRDGGLVVHDTGVSMLYPDASSFLPRLQRADVPHIVMTYGVSAEWQQLKLAASDYPAGFCITPTPHKATHLKELQADSSDGTNGTFDMRVADHGRGTYSASRLVFVDDKATAFDGFPESNQYKGFWLQRGKLMPGQQGEVPDNVEVIKSLDELSVTEEGEVVKTPEGEEPFTSEGMHFIRRMYADVHYGFKPVYWQWGVYLPDNERFAAHESPIASYPSFWTATQVGYSRQ